ncbi:MAG: sugar ABC transporter substrate-binding protein [Fastidiosipilaceae bacterium]
MKKHLISIGLVCVMLVSFLVGCGGSVSNTDSTSKNNEISDNSNETVSSDYFYRIGFVNQADSDPNCYAVMEQLIKVVESNEFRDQVGAPHNVEVLTADSNLDLETQTANVETLLAQGVDMMFIIGVETEGNSVSVKACNEAGVPVFMPFTEASEGDFAFVGWDEVQLGEMQGKWCAENLPENAQVCYLQGMPGREASDKREDGFISTLTTDRDDINILSKQAGNFNAADGMQVTEDWIQAYGDQIDCIVSADSQMISGSIEALKAAQIVNKIITGGVIHLGTWDLETIISGEQTFAVYAGMFVAGDLCAELAAKQYAGESIEHWNFIELANVTQDNYTDFFSE